MRNVGFVSQKMLVPNREYRFEVVCIKGVENSHNPDLKWMKDWLLTPLCTFRFVTKLHISCKALLRNRVWWVGVLSIISGSAFACWLTWTAKNLWTGPISLDCTAYRMLFLSLFPLKISTSLSCWVCFLGMDHHSYKKQYWEQLVPNLDLSCLMNLCR